MVRKSRYLNVATELNTLRYGQQQGVALLMVLVIIISLSLILPASYMQIATSYDLVAKEIERQHGELALQSLFDYTMFQDQCIPQADYSLYSRYKADQEKVPLRYEASIKCHQKPDAVNLEGTIHLEKHLLYLTDSRRF